MLQCPLSDPEELYFWICTRKICKLQHRPNKTQPRSFKRLPRAQCLYKMISMRWRWNENKSTSRNSVNIPQHIDVDEVQNGSHAGSVLTARKNYMQINLWFITIGDVTFLSNICSSKRCPCCNCSFHAELIDESVQMDNVPQVSCNANLICDACHNEFSAWPSPERQFCATHYASYEKVSPQSLARLLVNLLVFMYNIESLACQEHWQGGVSRNVGL